MDEDLVAWHDSYSVGFAPIDDQHKKLVAMINDLMQDCKKGGAVEKASFMLISDKAIEYAKIHFTDEELFLSKALYPDLAAHKKEHFNFLFEVVNIVSEVEAGRTTPLDMVRFLRNWLMDHIAVSDLKFAPHLKKK